MRYIAYSFDVSSSMEPQEPMPLGGGARLQLRKAAPSPLDVLGWIFILVLEWVGLEPLTSFDFWVELAFVFQSESQPSSTCTGFGPRPWERQKAATEAARLASVPKLLNEYLRSKARVKMEIVKALFEYLACPK